MASIVGKNLSALIEAKRLARTRMLQDPDFSAKCGDKLLQVQDKIQAAKEESKARGTIMRRYLISKNLITPKDKK